MRAVLVLAASVVLSGVVSCDTSTQRRAGPQIPDPPPGFAYDPNAYAARLVFPERTKLSQRAYGTITEPHNGITITEYAGPASRSDAQGAKDVLAERFPKAEYGPLQSLEIDGREAWGWLETSRYNGRVGSLEFKAVVPYEDVTYTVEFHTSQPSRMNADYLQSIVETFIVKKERALSSGQIVALAIAAVLAWFGWRVLREARNPATDRH